MDSKFELSFAKQVDLYFKDSFYRFDSLLKNYSLDSIFFNAYFYFKGDEIEFSLEPTLSLNPDDKFGSMPIAGVVLVNNRKVIIKSESARIASLINKTGKFITLPYLLWYEEELLVDDSPDINCDLRIGEDEEIFLIKGWKEDWMDYWYFRF